MLKLVCESLLEFENIHRKELYDESFLGAYRTIDELRAINPHPNDWLLVSERGSPLFLFDGNIINKSNIKDLKQYYKNLHNVCCYAIEYKDWLMLPDTSKLSTRR